MKVRERTDRRTDRQTNRMHKHFSTLLERVKKQKAANWQKNGISEDCKRHTFLSTSVIKVQKSNGEKSMYEAKSIDARS